MRKILWPVAALLALALAHGEARAQYSSQTPQQMLDSLTQSRSALTTRNWQTEDNCSKNAWAQYPDYTKEANGKRERAFKLCQMSGQLPPRAPLAAAPVPSYGAQPPR